MQAFHALLEEIRDMAAGVWRRRWVALATALVLWTIGWIVVALLPSQYTASGTIYVDTRSVLKPLLQGLAVDSEVGERELTMMQTALLSFPSLERVARETDRDVGVVTASDKEKMLKNLAETMTVTSLGRGSNLFKIDVVDTKPQRARDTVQSLISLFVESQLGTSRQDMDSAKRFLDEQIAFYHEQLKKSDDEIAQFKQANSELLAGTAGSYQTALDAANAQLSQAEGAIKEAMVDLAILQEQLRTVPPMIDMGTPSDAMVAGPLAGGPAAVQPDIAELEMLLARLKQQFTEQHPDVVAVTKRLNEARAQMQQQAAEPLPTATNAPSMKLPNLLYSQIQMSVLARETEIARLKERAARAREAVQRLEGRAYSAPMAEARLSALMRDHGILKQKYDDLLGRRVSAQISEGREETGDQVRFRVVDPPILPIQPSGPPRGLLMSGALLFSIAGGIGLALLLTMLDSTFASARQMRASIDLPVYASISKMISPEEQHLYRIGLIGFGTAVFLLLASYGTLMLIEQRVGLGTVVATARSANSVWPAVRLVSRGLFPGPSVAVN